MESSPQLAVATMEGSRYVTMEERIVVCEEDDDSELAKRMMNSHGFCDLAQAYLSTPAGAALLPSTYRQSRFVARVLKKSLGPTRFEMATPTPV